MQREKLFGSVYSVWCSYMSTFLFWLSSNLVVKGIPSSLIRQHYDISRCSPTVHVGHAKKNRFQFNKLRLTPYYKPVSNMCVCKKEWLLLPGAPHHFFPISIHQEKKGNLCIILKPIVAYLVGKGTCLSNWSCLCMWVSFIQILFHSSSSSDTVAHH